ncbi:MAG: hypothetical protein HY042_10215 [Spirochaetia bacterium]|nr:hypothetical protein [Spirochaetia bacterium]
MVPLRFFGIIFHDRGFGSGRFVLQNLRGRRMNLPFDPRRLDAMLARGEMPPTNTEPLDEWIPPPGRDFVTKSSYNVEDFSTREYEGADKEAKLKQLEQYARDWGKNSG